MNFADIASEAWQILQLKEAALHSVAQDRGKWRNALLCIGLGTLALSLCPLFFPIRVEWVTYRPDLFAVLFFALSGALARIFILFCMGLVAEKLFHSKLSAQGFFQVLGYASLVNVLGILPGLGGISSLWLLVVTAKLLHSEGKMQGEAIFIFLFILMVIFWLLPF
ncbi:hypothetical protein IPG41_01690 [Candidatus Peregrinibacteria bacterium]|nr:MAG: hypothetical protein IPG41_01690 [Candidatus Peregrinibacteria bacterium]